MKTIKTVAMLLIAATMTLGVSAQGTAKASTGAKAATGKTAPAKAATGKTAPAKASTGAKSATGKK